VFSSAALGLLLEDSGSPGTYTYSPPDVGPSNAGWLLRREGGAPDQLLLGVCTGGWL
jgi:hypothetical protein